MGDAEEQKSEEVERKPMPETEDAPVLLKACATAGCPFQATWHATLCCAACKDDGKCRHGPRCDRKPIPCGDATATNEKEGRVEAESHRKPCIRLSFPVMIDDGRRLTIEWDSNA